MGKWVMNEHPNDAEKVICPHCKGYNSIINELADGADRDEFEAEIVGLKTAKEILDGIIKGDGNEAG